ncbi:MAG: His/Gly/Thr/Pro-type tRNA ligase C-terminal domain-containing protein, partial [Candidatus Kapaibacterium sp.]
EYAQRTVPVVSRLRAAGIRCLHDVQHKSFKAQMKDADRCHASCVVFIGESEISDNTFTIKNMNSGVQTSIPMDVSLLIESIHRINSL